MCTLFFRMHCKYLYLFTRNKNQASVCVLSCKCVSAGVSECSYGWSLSPVDHGIDEEFVAWAVMSRNEHWSFFFHGCPDSGIWKTELIDLKVDMSVKIYERLCSVEVNFGRRLSSCIRD